MTGLLADLAIAIALGTIIFWAVEAEMWMVRRKRSCQGVHTDLLVRCNVRRVSLSGDPGTSSGRFQNSAESLRRGGQGSPKDKHARYQAMVTARRKQPIRRSGWKTWTCSSRRSSSTGEDERYLKMAGKVLEDQRDDVLDVWYGFVASHPHLIRYFSDTEGSPVEAYLGRVRERFKRWILDTCGRSYDREWLDYQQEIGLRHTHEKKNETDGAHGTPNHINMRYIVGFIYPITATMKPVLANKGHSAEDVDKMHQAWFKSVVLQVTLWCLPYARDGHFWTMRFRSCELDPPDVALLGDRG